MRLSIWSLARTGFSAVAESLDTLKVPYYDNEDMPDVEDPWMHDICTILMNLEHVIGVMDDEGALRKPHEIARVVESF